MTKTPSLQHSISTTLLVDSEKGQQTPSVSLWFLRTMIIKTEGEDLENKGTPEEAPPPRYEELASSSSTTELTVRSPREPPTSLRDLRAVNYVTLNRPIGSIDCTYILDPTIQIPNSFLPKLGAGQKEEERRNLYLKTKLGSIVADIILQHREGSTSSARRTRLEFKTTVGTMDLKVDATPSPNRPSFHLKAVTQSGTIILQLPRTFLGFLTITTTIGSITLSPEVTAANRWLSTGARTRRGFLGDASRIADSDVEDWTGDEVFIETTVGGVDIGFANPIPLSGSTETLQHSSRVSLRSHSSSGSRGSVRRDSHPHLLSLTEGPPPLMALLGYQKP